MEWILLAVVVLVAVIAFFRAQSRVSLAHQQVGQLTEQAARLNASLVEHERRIERAQLELQAAQREGAQLGPVQARLERAEQDLREERARREQVEQHEVALRTKLDAERQLIEQQRQSFDETKRQLVDTFQSVGSQALARNNAQFLALAEQRFAQLSAAQDEKSAAQHHTFGAMVQPIRDALSEQRAAVTQLSTHHAQAYGELNKKTELLATAHTQLSAATNKLHHSLSRTDVRGRWGEVSLQNVVELAGMTRHCDFHTQAHVETETGTQRPDLLINLPGRGCIVVDSKVPLKSYLDAHDEEADSDACLAAHAKALRGHVRTLADKAYWKAFERAPELVVLFMPLESALSLALQADPALHTDALESRVLIATPMTLMALLSTIAHGWRQEAVAENARKIADTGKQLCERIDVFVGHYAKVGKALESACKDYNNATGSLDSRLLVSARKLHELRASGGEVVSVPKAIEGEVRLPAGGGVNQCELLGAAE